MFPGVVEGVRRVAQAAEVCLELIPDRFSSPLHVLHINKASEVGGRIGGVSLPSSQVAKGRQGEAVLGFCMWRDLNASWSSARACSRYLTRDSVSF